MRDVISVEHVARARSTQHWLKNHRTARWALLACLGSFGLTQADMAEAQQPGPWAGNVCKYLQSQKYNGQCYNQGQNNEYFVVLNRKFSTYYYNNGTQENVPNQKAQRNEMEVD